MSDPDPPVRAAPPRQPPKVPRPEPIPRVPSPVDVLGRADNAHHWPLVETLGDGTCVVTFLWRDAEAEKVLLWANRLADETDLSAMLLDRIPGHDLWHASYRMGSDWRASYAFLVAPPGQPAPWYVSGGQVALRAALDRGQRDPRNPDTSSNRAGFIQSVVSLPDAPPQPWLHPRPEVPHGHLTRHARPGGRTTWIYDPPGVAHDVPVPLLVVFDGEVWTTRHSLPATLDNLLADHQIPPSRAVLLGAGEIGARWTELGADAPAAARVVDELIGWTLDRRAVSDERVAVGQSLGGLAALRAGLSRPDLVSGVVSHSASLWQDDLAHLVGGAAHTTRFYLSHGTQEWVLDPLHRTLAQQLGEAGATLAAVPVNGGHDYAWWRGGIADGLRWVLGRDG